MSDFQNLNTTPGMGSLGIILWFCSVVASIISNATPSVTPEWLDLILTIVSKLAPVISTYFLYIINKKAIDLYIKHLRDKK
jgi:threonine/homoserine/homoserine lactone efflux protein